MPASRARAATRARSTTEEISEDLSSLVQRKFRERSITDEITDDILGCKGCLSASEAASPRSPTSVWGPETPPPTPTSSKDLLWTDSKSSEDAATGRTMPAAEETMLLGNRKFSLQNYFSKYL
jgi:hypothetical protein